MSNVKDYYVYVFNTNEDADKYYEEAIANSDSVEGSVNLNRKLRTLDVKTGEYKNNYTMIYASISDIMGDNTYPKLKTALSSENTTFEFHGRVTNEVLNFLLSNNENYL